MTKNSSMSVPKLLIPTYPLQYIWPSATTPNKVYLYLHSCRYYSNKKKATLLVNVYPDIKWTFIFELAIDVSHHTFVNMPAGGIHKKHWDQAQPAGVDRSMINRRNKKGELTKKAGVPVIWSLGLEAKWDNGGQVRSLGADIEDKIKKLTDMISSVVSVVDQAVQWSKDAAEHTGLPVTFDVLYPTVSGSASWYLTPVKGEIATVGNLGIAFAPIIGAKGTIDLIAATINATAIVTTGSPAVIKLAKKFRGKVEELGGVLSADLIFTGALHLKLPDLEFNSLTGTKIKDGVDLEGKFKVEFKLSVEAGKIKSKNPTYIVKLKASVGVETGFEGGLKLDSDSDGTYIIPSVKFSGIKIVAEIEGEFGWWDWLGFSYKLEADVIKERTYTGEKTYFI